MRACWAATILVLVQPSPAFGATCRGTSVVPRVLALTHRRLHKSPCVRQPFVETSGSIAFSSLCSFPGNCALFLCVSSRVHSTLISVCRRFGRMTGYSSGIGLGKSCRSSGSHRTHFRGTIESPRQNIISCKSCSASLLEDQHWACFRRSRNELLFV